MQFTTPKERERIKIVEDDEEKPLFNVEKDLRVEWKFWIFLRLA